MSIKNYNHNNMIEYANRPFLRWQDMNETLIKKHNERVSPEDTVYHLGDFRFGANGPTFRQLSSSLNGNKVFIKGNHDRNNGVNVPLKYGIIETFGKIILLAHYPEEAEIIMAGGGIDLAFVGHVRIAWKFKKGMINVGIDQWDYYPVDAKQILKAYKRWEET